MIVTERRDQSKAIKKEAQKTVKAAQKSSKTTKQFNKKEDHK